MHLSIKPFSCTIPTCKHKQSLARVLILFSDSVIPHERCVVCAPRLALPAPADAETEEPGEPEQADEEEQTGSFLQRASCFPVVSVGRWVIQKSPTPHWKRTNCLNGRTLPPAVWGPPVRRSLPGGSGVRVDGARPSRTRPLNWNARGSGRSLSRLGPKEMVRWSSAEADED